MRLEAVRRLWERLRSSGERSLEGSDSFTSSELAAGQMVLPLLKDLDEARRNIEELASRTVALEVVLNLLPVAAIVLDDAGRFLTSNASARVLFEGPAVPTVILEAARKAIVAGLERKPPVVPLRSGRSVRVVPAEIDEPSGKGADTPEAGVAFLVPTDSSFEVPTAPLISRVGLSKTQAKVVGFIARGLTNKEIAKQLALSPETVHKHLMAVYQKTGLNSRAAVVALAFGARFGLASPAEP